MDDRATRWLRAAGVRALKTAAQAAVALIGTNAVGVTDVYGEFSAGDTIRVLSPDGQEIARGIAAYDAADIARLMGHQTADFPALVADAAHEEIIHRDNMVLMV